MPEAENAPCQLVGRNRRRHKKQGVKPQDLDRLFGQPQMSQMDGIKSPPITPTRRDLTSPIPSFPYPRLHHSLFNNPYSRNWPSPMAINLVVVNSSTPMGPKACNREVEMPISAPSPNWKPSLKRVEALTRTSED